MASTLWRLKCSCRRCSIWLRSLPVIPSVPWPSEYLLPNPTQACQQLAPCSLSFCSQTLPVTAKSTDYWERINACKMLRCRSSGKRQWTCFFSLSDSMRFWRPLQTAMRGNCTSSGFCMSSGGTILRWDHSDVLCCIVLVNASHGICEHSCCQCPL